MAATSRQFAKIEYVYNSDTTNADDTTSFANGAVGGLVPVVATDPKYKRVRFSRVFKHYRLEIQEDGIGPWLDIGSTLFVSSVQWNSGYTYYGMRIIPVNSLDLDVYFEKVGSSFEYGTGIITWTTENGNGTRWRIVGRDD